MEKRCLNENRDCQELAIESKEDSICVKRTPGGLFERPFGGR